MSQSLLLGGGFETMSSVFAYKDMSGLGSPTVEFEIHSTKETFSDSSPSVRRVVSLPGCGLFPQ